MCAMGIKEPCRLIFYHYHSLLREAVAARKHKDVLSKKSVAQKAKGWTVKFGTGPHPGGQFRLTDGRPCLPGYLALTMPLEAMNQMDHPARLGPRRRLWHTRSKG